MLQGIVIFLAVALIVFVIATVYEAFLLNISHDTAEEYEGRIEQLREDIRVLMIDKVELIEDNEKLIAQNQELLKMNRELLNEEKVIIEEEKQELNSLPLPDKPTNVISIEDAYDPAFTPDTHQWQLQQECQTDMDDNSPFRGARYYEYGDTRAYCTALSTNYTKQIGMAFEVELANGTKFNVICADYKNSLNDTRKYWLGTPCKNKDGEDAVCIIELLSDLNELSENVKGAGNFAANERLGGLYGHGGNVVRLTEIERWWKP